MNDSRKIVLVVDDDPGIVEVLCSFLDCEHFRPMGTSSVSEGLRLAETIAPVLVLCDWSMPAMSGLEFVRRLRAQTVTAPLHVILMSGYLPPDLEAIGATGYLQKPFELSDVLALMKTFSAKLLENKSACVPVSA